MGLLNQRYIRTAFWTLAILGSISQAHAELHVTTVAGGVARNGVPASSSNLSSPYFAAYDGKGNLYIADNRAHRIRMVNAKGIITTITGTGISGYTGDGGAAKTAEVSFPSGIAVDSGNNIYFSDNGNNRIRKIDTTGKISTIAGNGTAGFSGDGGAAVAAELAGPTGLAFDGSGNLFIADEYNNRVRKISMSGTITTIAGNGKVGFKGDGGKATNAWLDNPIAVLPDTNGNVYVSDFNNYRVREVTSAGKIKTVAGDGQDGCRGDGSAATAAAIGSPGGLILRGNTLLIAAGGCSRVRSVDLSSHAISTVAGSTGGFNGDGHTATTTEFDGLRDVLLDATGSLIVVDEYNSRVRKIDSNTQIVSTIAGGYIGDGGKGTSASLAFPIGIGFDATQNLYIVDYEDNRIRKVDASGNITTFAGNGMSGYSGDNGPATAATLTSPTAVTADSQGNIFIADIGGAIIRKVDSTGVITTFPPADDGPYFGLFALATDPEGNVYGVDADFCALWQITPTGGFNQLAGSANGDCGYNADGIPATEATLNIPSGVALDSTGNIYISDTNNNRVRKIDHATGLISTVAGNGTAGFSGDGGPATSAILSSPWAVAVDAKGNLYIADVGNGRVRIVNTAGIIETYAGDGTLAPYNGDGLPATKTNLDYPTAVAVNGSGVVYVGDAVANRVRKIH